MSSPILEMLKKQGVPRSEWARAWLAPNYFGEIPESIDAEEWEVMPAELREDIALYFEKSASDKEQ